MKHFINIKVYPVPRFLTAEFLPFYSLLPSFTFHFYCFLFIYFFSIITDFENSSKKIIFVDFNLKKKKAKGGNFKASFN